MRTLKFRQVLYRDNKFLSWHHWGFLPDGLIGPITGLGLDNEDQRNSQQFTGMTDSRGMEIYEGDILDDDEKHPCCVLFVGGSFDINNPSCCQHCAAGIASHGSLSEYLAFGSNPRVIGNIHQNPELLNGQSPFGG